MKKNNAYSIFAKLSGVFLAFILIVGFTSLRHNDTKNTNAYELSTEEIENLKYLREEEKLARDVYLYALEKYHLRIFENISSSEQRHMDRVLKIMNYYDIPDNSSEEIGVFNNENLQLLYDQLTEKADKSVTDALIVGATIEDLDIKDIQNFLQKTRKENITAMYQVLMCGSRNHLRAYCSKVEAYGGTYEANYLSQAEFESILEGDREQCGQKYR